jgi:hypothetical protein
MNARVADFSLEFPSMGVLSVDEKSIEIERVRENDDVREVRKDRRKRMKPEGFQGEDGTHRSRQNIAMTVAERRRLLWTV